MEAVSMSGNELLAHTLFVSKDVTLYEVDQETLVYQQQTQKYFKIGKLAKELICQLQAGKCTGYQLISGFSSRMELKETEIESQVEQFLQQMLKSGVLVLEGAYSGTSEFPIENNNARPGSSPSGRMNYRPLVRLLRMRDVDWRLDRLSRVIPGIHSKIAFYWFGAISLTALATLIYTLNNHYIGILSGTDWLLVLPFLFLHLVGHELSHAMMCKKLGGNVREVGIGLLYYVMPVAYVDLTDTYRLDRRSRAKMAIIGPIYDLSMCLVSSSMVLVLTGFNQSLAYTLLFVQFMIFCFNCNLFIPSDLFRTLENLFKMTNVRKRSFEYLKCVLMNQPKPVYLQGVKGIKENFYLLYGVLSIIYIAGLSIVFIYMYLNIFL